MKIMQCVSNLSLYRRNVCLQQSSLNCNVHARSRSIHSGLAAIFLFVIGFHITMAVAEALPHWVSNPPHDSQRWMYGIGSGPTLQQAQQDALKNIAGKLMTNIKAVTESRAISRDGTSTQSFEQNIQTYVNGTNLSSFNTISTTSYQYGYFILIRMSRSNFVRNTRMRLEQLNQTIAIDARDAEKARNLRRFVAYRSLLPKINNAEELGILLQSADHNFSAAQYLSNYDRYRERAQIVANETRLMIKSTPQLHPLVEVIARILSDAKIATTSHMPANGIIDIQGSIRRRDIFSTKFVVLNITIKSMDFDGSVFAEHNYELRGSSVFSYSFAIRNAVEKMVQYNSHVLLNDLGLE